MTYAAYAPHMSTITASSQISRKLHFEKDLFESDNFLSKGGGVADFDFHDHRPAFTMNKHTL